MHSLINKFIPDSIQPTAQKTSFRSVMCYVLQKLVDYEDFLEQLCLLVLSDVWVYQYRSIIEAPPAEEGAEDGAAGEEKQDPLAEETLATRVHQEKKITFIGSTGFTPWL